MCQFLWKDTIYYRIQDIHSHNRWAIFAFGINPTTGLISDKCLLKGPGMPYYREEWDGYPAAEYAECLTLVTGRPAIFKILTKAEYEAYL